MIFLKNLKIKEIYLIVSIAVIVGMSQYIRIQKIQIEQDRLAYENPRKEIKIKTVRIEGPVRIVTKIVESSGGGREVLVQEDRGQTVLASENDLLSDPHFRPDTTSKRILFGLSNRNVTVGSLTAYTFWTGYSFKNRFDVMGGLNYDERINTHLMFVYRF